MISDPQVLAFEDIPGKLSTGASPPLQSLSEFFQREAKGGFFAVASEKLAACPAGCGASFTTRPGLRYHLLNHKHSLPNFPPERLDGTLGDFSATLRFPLHFEREDVEEYWTINFVKPPTASEPASPKRTKKKRPSGSETSLPNVPEEAVCGPHEFDWYWSACKQVNSPCDQLRQPSETVQLLFKDESLLLATDLPVTLDDKEQFLFVGSASVVSKVICISERYLCLVCTPRDVSLLNEQDCSASVLFIYDVAAGEIKLEFYFDFVIVDCVSIYFCESRCILGILRSNALVLFSFSLMQTARAHRVSSPLCLASFAHRAVSLGYSPVSKCLACGCIDGTLLVYAVHQLYTNPILCLRNHHFGAVVSVGLSDTTLASIGHDGTLKIVSLACSDKQFASASLLPGRFARLTRDHRCIYADCSSGLQALSFNCQSTLPASEAHMLRLEPAHDGPSGANVATAVDNLFESGIYFGTSTGDIFHLQRPGQRSSKCTRLYSWFQREEGSVVAKTTTRELTAPNRFALFVIDICVCKSQYLCYSLSNGIVHISKLV